MGVIKALDPRVANLIAAGEVVENVQSVVKELIENSLDANARKIAIDLTDSGLKAIRITDDGDGMDEADLHLATERHATSKIARADDLFRVLSLGFRGEALASLASVAELTITSSQTVLASHVLTIKDGVKTFSKGPAFKGTQIEAKNLFYQTPARLKYLKRPETELHHVQSELYHAALAFPSVKFTLRNDGKTLFKTIGDGNVMRIFHELYGSDIASSMHPFSFQDRDYTVQGYYGEPRVQRANAQHIHVIINHRVVRNKALIKGIKDAYAPYIPTVRYPVVLVQIQTDPLLVDVNVHPQKKEVKLAEESRLKKALTQALSEALKTTSLVARVTQPKDEKMVNYQFESLHETVLETAETPHIKPTQATFPDMDYVGQVHGTYLVMQGIKSVYLIDQHAAAERVRYEQYYHAMQQDLGHRQTVTVPLEIPLSKLETADLKPHLKTFEAFGLSVTLDANTLRIQTIPHYFHPGKEEEYALNMIETLLAGETLSRGDLIDQMAKDLACKHSIKGNEPISLSEVNALMSDLKQCINPFHCPHGRPVMVEFTQPALETMFGRIMA